MEIQSLGPLALLVCEGEEELRRRGIRSHPLTPSDALRLAREALERRNLPLSRLEQISAMEAPERALLLLHLTPPEAEWFHFPDLAQALHAVSSLSQPPEGPLVWCRGYALRSRAEGERSVLSEFAAPLSPAAAEEFEAQGSLILNADALKKLWQTLGSNSKPQKY